MTSTGDSWENFVSQNFVSMSQVSSFEKDLRKYENIEEDFGENK